MTEADAKEMISAVDADGSGGMEFEEFFDLMIAEMDTIADAQACFATDARGIALMSSFGGLHLFVCRL